MDKLYPLVIADGKHPDWRTSRVLGCFTYGAPDAKSSGVLNAIKTLRDACDFIGVRVDFVHGSAGKAGDIEKRPAVLKRAYKAGKSLAE